MMKRLHSREEGFTVVFAALAMVVLLGMSALAIDGGVLFTAKSQLQNAVDAAALAGASGLVDSQQEAVNRAVSVAARNQCIDQPVMLSSGNMTFPTPDQIQVTANQTVNLFFARVLGINSATVNAVAIAELGTLSGTSHMKPWAIPQFPYQFGEPVTLKEGSHDKGKGKEGDDDGGDGIHTPNSWYNPVCFPAMNRGNPQKGGSEYRENIISGSQDQIFIGDQLMVEPGNMVGPTKQGVNEVVAMDPNASWDGSGGKIVGSAYPGFSSPRVFKIAMYDPAYPPSQGRSSITITGLGVVFLEGLDGKEVKGRFIKIVTPGTFGPGTSSLMGVKLVK